MKTVYLSAKELSRCSHCGRHNQVKKEDLNSAQCEFCGQVLLSSLDQLADNQISVKSPTAFGAIGQKLLVGLMTATAGLSACEQEEAVENKDQGSAQSDMQVAPKNDMKVDMQVQETDQLVAGPLYGIPAGEFPPDPDMNVVQSDEFLPQPEYGAPVGDYQVQEADATLEVTDYGLPAPDTDMGRK